jgi:hypothetical protein
MGRSVREVPQATYYTLWYQDLEKIIREVYGQSDYSVLEQLDGEFRNGMYDIWNSGEGEEWIGDNWDGVDREEEFRNWIAGNEDAIDPDPRALLWHMAENGHIPAGDYLINIFW